MLDNICGNTRSLDTLFVKKFSVKIESKLRKKEKVKPFVKRR